jgi:hypothetical protein
MKLAALHIRHMIETQTDMEKSLTTCPLADLESYDRLLEQAASPSPVSQRSTPQFA